MIEPADPGVVQRSRERAVKVAPLCEMLRIHCRFTHKESGAEFRQRRIGDRTAIATYTVTRTDGESKTFRHGREWEALCFATAESVEKNIDGKDHPLMQAAAADAS